MNDEHETSTATPNKSGKKKSKKRSRRSSEAPARDAAAARKTASEPATKRGNTNTILLVLLALVAGAAGGWFLRDAKAAEEVGVGPDGIVSTAPVGSGSVGPCASWAAKVCEGVGEKMEACGEARSAAALLPEGACVKALTDVPGTVAKAKAARSSCDELIQKVCKDLGKDTETCKMVTGKTASFPTAQCKEMLANYDKVIGELKQMEKRNAPLSAADAAKVASGAGPSFGPADAKVTVVEFSDFECPYCAMAAQTMTALKKKYGDKVRFVFRQFPLSFHKNAQLTAEASLAAHAQGKFWEFHDKVFENQKALERADLETYAKDVGLDMAKFNKALDDGTFQQAVKDEVKLGEGVGVSGTPSFFIGAKRAGEPSVEAISAIIDAALAAP